MGNGIRADTWTEFLERFGDIRVCECYGATEGNIGFVNYIGKVGAIGKEHFLHKVREETTLTLRRCLFFSNKCEFWHIFNIRITKKLLVGSTVWCQIVQKYNSVNTFYTGKHRCCHVIITLEFNEYIYILIMK